MGIRKTKANPTVTKLSLIKKIPLVRRCAYRLSVFFTASYKYIISDGFPIDNKLRHIFCGKIVAKYSYKLCFHSLLPSRF